MSTITVKTKGTKVDGYQLVLYFYNLPCKVFIMYSKFNDLLHYFRIRQGEAERTLHLTGKQDEYVRHIQWVANQ